MARIQLREKLEMENAISLKNGKFWQNVNSVFRLMEVTFLVRINYKVLRNQIKVFQWWEKVVQLDFKWIAFCLIVIDTRK